MIDFVQINLLLQVLLIDLVLAGDNAVVVGVAAAGVRKEQRAKVIVVGIAGATLMRALFALVATQLLAIIGLLLAGGILLLWVCWKLWREIQARRQAMRATGEAPPPLALEAERAEVPPKSMRQAIVQIMVADVSMSLDNVLAVAGAAHQHPWILVTGLVLSVALMGLGASIVARLLKRYFWLTYAGLAIILYVALSMIWEGAIEIADAVNAVTLIR